MSTEVAIETARKLISIYTEKKLPKYTELNKRYPEGFTRERIERNPEGSLFQMIILAAYDRRPYTLAAKGFEPIWGLVDSGPSLPHILRSNDLFDLDSVIALSERDLASRLAQCQFCRRSLDSDGANTCYSKTFKQVADLVNNQHLLSEIRLARIAHDVKQLHTHLDDIHGIGPTIASKIVMYSLREFPFFGSSIDPRELYPAVEHLLKEYHNDLLAKELKKQYGPGIIDQVFEELKKLGDPLAIDALFYVHREEPKLKESLLYMAEADGKTRKRESRDEDDRVLPECMGSSRNDEATTEPDGIIVEAKIIAPDGAKTARREITISKKQTAWLTSRGGPLDLSIVERKYGATRSGTGTRQVLLIPIRLRIESRGYGAKFHYHAKWRNSWIGSPMNDGAIKLAKALADEGFLRTGPIRFRVVANEMLTLNTQ